MSVAKLLTRQSPRFGWGSSSPRLRRRFSRGPLPEDEEVAVFLPEEWRRAAYPRLVELSDRLRNLHHVDSKKVKSSIRSLISPTREFKSLARAFISSSSQMDHEKKIISAVALRSLTNVCNLLEITAQQRKVVRLNISPQITEHRIWHGALESVLRDLAAECKTLDHRRFPSAAMAEQIITCCLKFMADAASAETPLWMQLSPNNKNNNNENKSNNMKKSWGEVAEMMGHLSACLAKEERLSSSSSVEKVEAMKEGLYQIKDLLLEREIGYREARVQDSLVQKRLCKSLGHSSRCLFILLVYYLYGSVVDLEVDLCWVSGGAAGKVVDAGKILVSGEEEMVMNAVKEIDMVLGVMKLVWETAGMKGGIDLRGHVWWSGAEQRSLVYRGNQFFIRDFKL